MPPQIARIAIPPHGRRFPVPSVEDSEEIYAVLKAYGRLYDDNLIDDFLNLITDEAVFYPNWPGVAPDEVTGRKAIDQFFRGARDDALSKGIQPHHYATNMLITSSSGEAAEATVSMLYAEFADGRSDVKMLGQYDYALIKQGDRWFISRWSMRYDK